jgi:hypothetical protein
MPDVAGRGWAVDVGSQLVPSKVRCQPPSLCGSGSIVVIGSVAEQDAFAEQVGFGVAVLLSFDHLAVHVPFYAARTLCASTVPTASGKKPDVCRRLPVRVGAHSKLRCWSSGLSRVINAGTGSACGNCRLGLPGATSRACPLDLWVGSCRSG